MFAVALHSAAFLFIFLVVPRCTKWLRGKATPIGKRSWQRMRRTCPAACHRMECHRDKLTVFCTLLCFVGHVATSSARYGVLCGWIMVLLPCFPLHGTAEQCSTHVSEEEASRDLPRHPERDFLFLF